MTQSFSKIWIFIIFIIIFFGGIFAWWYLKIPEKEANLPKEITKEKNAGWKIYRDDELGFEIKYPQDWEFSRNAYSGFTPPNSGAEIRFKPINKVYNLPHGEISYIPVNVTAYNFPFPDQELLNTLREKHKEVLINNLKFIEFEPSKGEPAHSFLVENPKNGYAFITNFVPVIIKMKAGIAPQEESSYQTIFNQMLSTFRFLE